MVKIVICLYLFYRGTNEAVKLAHQLLTSLQQDPTREITQLLQQLKVSSTTKQQQHVAQDGLLALPVMDLSASSLEQQRRSSALPIRGQEISKVPASRLPTAVISVASAMPTGDSGSQQTASRSSVSSGVKSQRALQSDRKLASLISSHAAVERLTQQQQHSSVPLISRVPPVSITASSPVTARSSGPVRQLFTSSTTPSSAALVSSLSNPPPQSPSLPPQSKPLPTQARSVSIATTTATTRSNYESQRHPPPPPPPHSTVAKTTPLLPRVSSSLPSDVIVSTAPSKPPPTKQLSVPASTVTAAAAAPEQSQNVIEQILKTPSIFQEAASQIAQPKKYSDAVGKKQSMEQPSCHPPKPSVMAAPMVYPPPVGSGAPLKAAINLAPGSRPQLGSDIANKVCIERVISMITKSIQMYSIVSGTCTFLCHLFNLFGVPSD